MKLAVYLQRVRIGTLEATTGEGYDYTFSYLPEIAKASVGEVALSVQLPIQAGSYAPSECRPFFEGLLPEHGIRQVVARRLHLDEGNSIGLLGALGRDAAGAVVLLPEEEELPPESQASVEWLEQTELEELVDELPRKPLGVDSNAGRSRVSLAGLQSKAVLVRSGAGTFGLPLAEAPSTHILKPEYGAEYPDISVNEHFCMRVAECFGLSVARTELVWIAKRRCLLVERFDRSTDGRQVIRLHQEDLCQATGRLPGQKYEQSEAGPGFDDLDWVIRRSAVSWRPGPDMTEVYRTGIFNYLIGNADAHGKNWALLYGENGIQLAPRYDLVCTAVYENPPAPMAMAIGEEFEPDALELQHWLDFRAQCGLSARGLSDELTTAAAKAVDCAKSVRNLARAEGWHISLLDRIVEFCEARADRVFALV